MALQSDQQGFLTGETVADIRRAIDHLSGIRADVAAIRRAVTGASGRRGGDSVGTIRPGDSAARARHDNTSASAAGVSPPPNAPTANTHAATPTPRSGNSPLPNMAGNIRNLAVATPNNVRTRDTSGRFVSAGQPAVAVMPSSVRGRDRNRDGRFTSNDGNEGEDKPNTGILDGFADRIATAVSASAEGAAEADPTIKAFQEVAEPMKRLAMGSAGKAGAFGRHKPVAPKQADGIAPEVTTASVPTGTASFYGGNYERPSDRGFRLFRRKNSAYQDAYHKRLSEIAGNDGTKANRNAAKKGVIGRLFGSGKDNSTGKDSIAALQLAELRGINEDGDGEIKHLKAIDIALNGTLFGKIAGFLLKLMLLPLTLPFAIGKAIVKNIRSNREEAKKERMLKNITGIWVNTARTKLDVMAIRRKMGAGAEASDPSDGSGGGGGFLSGAAGFLGAAIGALFGRVAPLALTAITAIGTALLAGIGTVLGVIFSPIGLAIGAIGLAAWGLFTEDGRKFFANVADKMYQGWVVATDYIKSKWDDGVKFFTDLWGPIAKFFSDKFGVVKNAVVSVANKGNEFIKDKTGVDVKKTAESGFEKVVESFSRKVIEPTEKAYEKAVDFTSRKVIEPTAKVFSDTKNWVLGKTSQFFESGKGGAGTVSTGKGDHGGASYGTYQLSSTQGTLQKFLKSTPFGRQFEGMVPGSKEFNDKWKSVAKSEPDFGNAQHEFIKNTHFDPQMEKLKNAGIDLSDRGAAVKDSVWSTSVQFGGNSGLIEKALKGRDASKLSDMEIISAIQDYKIANNDRLFSKSSGNVKAGTLNRALKEKDKLLNLASSSVNEIPPINNLAANPGKASQTQTAYAPAPKVPVFPQPPAVAEAPPVIQPLASSGSGRNVTVTLPNGDVGQDVRDRRIAHIVSGGLSG